MFGHPVISVFTLFSDKSGDVFRFDLNSENDQNGQCLMGHLSMLLDIKLSKCGKFIITCDRDEKIRVSHYPNAYNIHNFCLGHTDFVTCIGNVQLFMKLFSHKIQNSNFTKMMKKIVKLCLHSSYIAQNSFPFDEIFHRKFKIPIFGY